MNDDHFYIGERHQWGGEAPLGFALPELRHHAYVVGKTGSPLGKVSGAARGGAHDYLLVDTAGEKGALVPFIKQFVLEIDSKAGRIVVELPEGLI